MKTSLNFLIPNNFVTIVDENLNAEVEEFMTPNELELVKQSVSLNLASKLAADIVKLGKIHLYICQKNLDIYHAISFPLPIDLLLKYSTWDSYSINQEKIDSIDSVILVSASYCEVLQFDLNSDLAAVRSLKNTINGELKEATLVIDTITKTDGNTQKRMLYSEIEILIESVNKNYQALKKAHTKLFATLKKYNKERTKIANILIQ